MNPMRGSPSYRRPKASMNRFSADLSRGSS